MSFMFQQELVLEASDRFRYHYVNHWFKLNDFNREHYLEQIYFV